MVDYRISNGKHANYFKKVTVSSTTFGSSSDGYLPNIFIPFSTAGFSLSNEGTGVVEVSFDGYNVHDQLDSTMTTKFAQYDNRVACKIWFKIASGSAAVCVRAWSIR